MFITQYLTEVGKLACIDSIEETEEYIGIKRTVKVPKQVDIAHTSIICH